MLKSLSLILVFTMTIATFAAIALAGGINWENSLSAGLDSAKNQNKPVMIDFYTDWCGWCKKLDNDTYSNAKVQDLANKFICIKINGDNARTDVAKYGVNGFPTIVFLDSNGKEIDRNVGYATADVLAGKMEKLIKK